MNNENLIPTNRRTKEEAREIGRGGGIASGKARREKKLFREYLEVAFAAVMRGEDGTDIKNPLTGKKMTLKESSMIKLAASAAKGNIKAIEQAARLLGEWEQNITVKADITAKGEVALGFDPQQAIRDLYSEKKGGEDE